MDLDSNWLFFFFFFLSFLSESSTQWVRVCLRPLRRTEAAIRPDEQHSCRSSAPHAARNYAVQMALLIFTKFDTFLQMKYKYRTRGKHLAHKWARHTRPAAAAWQVAYYSDEVHLCVFRVCPVVSVERPTAAVAAEQHQSWSAWREEPRSYWLPPLMKLLKTSGVFCLVLLQPTSWEILAVTSRTPTCQCCSGAPALMVACKWF